MGECPINPTIRLLSWTAQTMFTTTGEQQQWFLEFGKSPMDICYSEEFKYLDRNRYNCTYTNDKSQYHTSDVILFRGRRLDQIAPPTERSPNQSWLFYEFEPPYKVWDKTNLSNYNSVFNLTSTYSEDSDIPYTYYKSKMCVRNATRYNELAGVDYTGKKTRVSPVGWMVSVCTTQSRREQYVDVLKKYVGVDVYGGCGSLKCGSNNMSTWTTDDCDRILFHEENSYKFYLAFENSLCEDYISEKLWRMMKLDVVPVVMGAVDYAKILPRDSYIDARDFSSARMLAAYLKHLHRNNSKYNQYLRNKNSLDCFNTVTYLPRLCALCKGLHDVRAQSHGQGKVRVVHDLSRFMSSRQCIQPRHFFRDRPDKVFL